MSVGVDYARAGDPVTLDWAAAPSEQMRVLMALIEFQREIAPAASRQLKFVVTNHGTEAASFALDVRTTIGTVRGPSPATVTIEPGASAIATFVLTIPPSTPAGERVNLRMIARNTADPGLSNSAILELEVADPAAAGDEAPTVAPDPGTTAGAPLSGSGTIWRDAPRYTSRRDLL